MGLIRRELLDRLAPWGESAAAVVVTASGPVIALQGGPVLFLLGAIVGVIGLGWAIQSIRRRLFTQAGDGPGVVEIDEGQVSYLGPHSGGFVALADLAEIRLVVTGEGKRLWRLRTAAGEALLIPVDARGADTLFDAFAGLPGMETGRLIAALSGNLSSIADLPALPAPVWHRGSGRNGSRRLH